MDVTTTDPTTGHSIRRYAWMPEAEVEKRLDRSARAFEAHRQTSFAERAEAMQRAADLLENHARRYAELMTREMGKPVQAAEGEVRKCARGCRYFAEQAEAFLSPEPVETDAARSYVAYQPLGPILAVMPWNFPFWQVIRFAAPALMAGNTGLLKHAPNVPGCAEALSALFAEAGFPEGVFQHLFVDNDGAARVIRDPRVQAVTLTGSVGAGRSVAGTAGSVGKKTVLELGGSDPFIVLADADLDRAAALAVSSRTQNNGQSCIAAKRFFLERSIAEPFTERFTALMRMLRVGNPMEETTDIGPLARADLRDQLHDQVRRSLEAGAVCLLGGRFVEGPGFFYEPTVLTGVRPGMAAFDEELFGPVAALTVVDNADEAVRLANQSVYGLGGTIVSADRARAEALALRLEVGSAFVNEMVKSDPRLPFGGIKQSGYGRELAPFGIREFVNIKTVWIA